MTYKEAQEALREMAGVYEYRARMRVPTGAGRYTAGQAELMNAGAYGRKKKQDPNRFDLMRGQEPSDADIRRFMKMHTTRSAEKAQGRSAQAAGATAPAPGPGGTQSAILAKMLADQKAKLDESNRQNQLRYDQGLGELSTLRDRNQQRVGNWGHLREMQNREQANANLKAVEANLANRGLGNSTLTDAFRLRNERDLSMLNQDVSERRDDRMSRYDTSDTGSLVGFVERRNDIPPNEQSFLELARELGKAQAMEAEAAKRAAEQPLTRTDQPQRRIAGPGGLSAKAAQRMQEGMQGANPFGAAMSYFANNQPYRWGGINAQYTPRNGMSGQQHADAWYGSLTPEQQANVQKRSNDASPAQLAQPSMQATGRSIYAWANPPASAQNVAMPYVPPQKKSQYWN
jgi:hypothetical protein